MEAMLRRLFALQQIDSHLDELDDMKGDLPTEVNELEEKYAGMKEHLSALEQGMKQAFAERDAADTDILSFKEKMERYKAQQFEVRTNKQYDALTREMDNAVATIAKLEKEMEALEGKATIARTDIESTKALIAELEKTLGEKREALAQVCKETEEEELDFKHRREKALRGIEKPSIDAYERIRKSKRGGKAVVGVLRGACGGCFARIPPQKLLELRQNKKMFTCEHCGRILVSDEIANSNGSAD